MLEDLLKDILQEGNIMITINANGAIMEMRSTSNLPMRRNENWITIGDDSGPCHMHINKDQVREIRFDKEIKENHTSYSIKLLNPKGERVVAAFFTKMNDENGQPIKERTERYENLFRKYGGKEIILLTS